MLEWSVAALQALGGIEQIVIALPADELTAAPAGTLAVAGGRQRSESVRNALAASGHGDPVIVHDAARPLATAQLFGQALIALERHPDADAVIAAAPVTDTIKQVGGDGATVQATLDRAALWAVQTPQVFRRGALVRALTRAGDDELARATDDAWLIERDGGTVRVLASDPGNIKITTREDLRMAELILRQRQAANAPPSPWERGA
jgi:2-C-methyl-D-erythritol 4-phosphate cytidylyltransferase